MPWVSLNVSPCFLATQKKHYMVPEPNRNKAAPLTACGRLIVSICKAQNGNYIKGNTPKLVSYTVLLFCTVLFSLMKVEDCKTKDEMQALWFFYSLFFFFFFLLTGHPPLKKNPIPLFGLFILPHKGRPQKLIVGDLKRQLLSLVPRGLCFLDPVKRGAIQPVSW